MNQPTDRPERPDRSDPTDLPEPPDPMDLPLRTLPVAVIGAGPVGLAAAAHLAERGIPFLLLEGGSTVGAHVREWGHVRLFSPWKFVIDPVVRRLLDSTGDTSGGGAWTPPGDDLLPTGHDLVDRLLEPLAAHPAIARSLRLEHRVERVGRLGFDKVRTEGRERARFELVTSTPDGPRRILARAVIDASGTWATPNPAGAGGLPAGGEAEVSHRLRSGIPDVAGADRARYEGRRVAVIGSGHSAFNVLLELQRLQRNSPDATTHWILRRPLRPELFGGGAADGLPARGLLGCRLHRLVTEGKVEVHDDFGVVRFETEGKEGSEAIRLVDREGRSVGPVDEVIVTTGFRPDLDLTREVRVRLDEAIECPAALAPLIDPNEHSCGTVPPHGYRELGHPEADFYTVGMKSYGRAPTFLLLTGYEQVRSIAAALAGELDEAGRVELTLPETGVCLTGVGGGAGCC